MKGVTSVVALVAIASVGCGEVSEPAPAAAPTGPSVSARSARPLRAASVRQGIAAARTEPGMGNPGAVVAKEPHAARREPVDRRAMRAAVHRASHWLAAFDAGQLRFDAAIGLHALRGYGDLPVLDSAYDSARKLARRDRDNPLLPLAGVSYEAPKAAVADWVAPGPEARRVNVNRVVAEAAHCAAHGMREQTLDYLAGAMRDDGGYHTAHAAWALALARDRGCVPPARVDAIAGPLRAEMAEALAAAGDPRTTLEADLMAERLLMLVLLGSDPAALAGPASRLVAHQQSDGSWRLTRGAAADAEPPYYAYHATLLSAWALAALGEAAGGAIAR